MSWLCMPVIIVYLVGCTLFSTFVLKCFESFPLWLFCRALCDTNDCGKLSKEQFALAFHFINQKLTKGIDPPQVLTADMIPPSERTTLQKVILECTFCEESQIFWTKRVNRFDLLALLFKEECSDVILQLNRSTWMSSMPCSHVDNPPSLHWPTKQKHVAVQNKAGQSGPTWVLQEERLFPNEDTFST